MNRDAETFYTKTVSSKRKLWTLNRETTALLIIDMQNDFVREGSVLEVPKIRSQIPKIKKLIETCRELGIPVIYTKQVYPVNPKIEPLIFKIFPILAREGLREGTEGAEICEELAPKPGDIIIKKWGYSAFYNTDLEIILRSIKGKNIDTLIICGTVTNICCESTARDAFERGYKVVFGSDITSSWTDEFQTLALKIIEYAFGRVMTCDEIIRALKYGED